MRFPSFKNELKSIKEGYHFVAGCDEVGVSPLAGPVVSAACLINPVSVGKYRSKNKWYYRVRDSKTTSEEEREILMKEILENTIAHGIGVVWQEEIDVLNIHNASLEAMRRATEDMLSRIEKKDGDRMIIFIDGRFKIPNLDNSGLSITQEILVAGDAQVLSISAASIIAKVYRDNIMKRVDRYFPEYGFTKHKGYPTKAHKDAVRRFGATPFHRRSFFRKDDLRDVKGL